MAGSKLTEADAWLQGSDWLISQALGLRQGHSHLFWRALPQHSGNSQVHSIPHLSFLLTDRVITDNRHPGMCFHLAMGTIKPSARGEGVLWGLQVI